MNVGARPAGTRHVGDGGGPARRLATPAYPPALTLAPTLAGFSWCAGGGGVKMHSIHVLMISHSLALVSHMGNGNGICRNGWRLWGSYFPSCPPLSPPSCSHSLPPSLTMPAPLFCFCLSVCVAGCLPVFACVSARISVFVAGDRVFRICCARLGPRGCSAV